MWLVGRASGANLDNLKEGAWNLRIGGKIDVGHRKTQRKPSQISYCQGLSLNPTLDPTLGSGNKGWIEGSGRLNLHTARAVSVQVNEQYAGEVA